MTSRRRGEENRVLTATAVAERDPRSKLPPGYERPACGAVDQASIVTAHTVPGVVNFICRWCNGLMDGPSYRGYRSPCEIIAHCVWLYFRFNLSLGSVRCVSKAARLVTTTSAGISRRPSSVASRPQVAPRRGAATCGSVPHAPDRV